MAGPASRLIRRRQPAATLGQLAATSHNGRKGSRHGRQGRQERQRKEQATAGEETETRGAKEAGQGQATDSVGEGLALVFLFIDPACDRSPAALAAKTARMFRHGCESGISRRRAHPAPHRTRRDPSPTVAGPASIVRRSPGISLYSPWMRRRMPSSGCGCTDIVNVPLRRMSSFAVRGGERPHLAR